MSKDEHGLKSSTAWTRNPRHYNEQRLVLGLERGAYDSTSYFAQLMPAILEKLLTMFPFTLKRVLFEMTNNWVILAIKKCSLGGGSILGQIQEEEAPERESWERKMQMGETMQGIQASPQWFWDSLLLKCHEPFPYSNFPFWTWATLYR